MLATIAQQLICNILLSVDQSFSCDSPKTHPVFLLYLFVEGSKGCDQMIQKVSQQHLQVMVLVTQRALESTEKLVLPFLTAAFTHEILVTYTWLDVMSLQTMQHQELSVLPPHQELNSLTIALLNSIAIGLSVTQRNSSAQRNSRKKYKKLLNAHLPASEVSEVVFIFLLTTQ